MDMCGLKLFSLGHRLIFIFAINLIEFDGPMMYRLVMLFLNTVKYEQDAWLTKVWVQVISMVWPLDTDVGFNVITGARGEPLI